MGHPVATLDVCKARDLISPRSGERWGHEALSGYLTELVGDSDSANLSVAGRLVLHAQTAGELVAWVTTRRDIFFPPDLAAVGVDLDTLPVVWAEEGADAVPGDEYIARGGKSIRPTASAARDGNSQRAGKGRTSPGFRGKLAGRAVRATERLLRSGAFGLVVIDLADGYVLHPVGQGRLLRLAKTHDAQVLILRPGRADGVYGGSLVTVRVESRRERIAPGRFRCTITNIKDKREGPGWTTSEEFDGPPGVY